MKDGIHNALLEKVDIGYLDDNPCRPLMIFLFLDFGGASTCYSGTLDDGTDVTNPHFISMVLGVTDCVRLNDVKKRPIRAKIDCGVVTEFGHFLKDHWYKFCQREVDSPLITV